MSVHVYIVNHTHWDREWFLTAEYTSRWIPGLIRSLEQRVASRPSYRYLLDGQTLVVEDLLQVAPEMEPQVRELVENGHLTIGPYYSQPDWQLGSGELLVRNLVYGMQDTRRYRGSAGAGWLVDTFGHISQAPQIHALFGVRALYVWRGVPKLVPYFDWQGADGSQILAINLFGGYRNLYGVTHAPEVAVRRLVAEVARLSPFYPTPDIPLFDGYDLEDDPEDPLAFYAQAEGLDPEIELHEATPASFASLVAGRNLPLTVLHGELNSGKYGATFPGAFSARTYLKVMAHDCQELLFRRCEPLAALASLSGWTYPAGRFEQLGRLLLQNGIHDCICGVSIDQVHEKMTWSYRRAFDDLQAILQQALAHLLGGFAPGEYAVSTNPFAGETWLPVEDGLLRLETNGVGIWPVSSKLSLEALPLEREISGDFTWSNNHYAARLQPDGRLYIGESTYGEMRVYEENGDTYSDERGAYLGSLLPASPVRIIARSSRHCILEYECAWQGGSAWASARIRLTLDPTPLLRWQIDLDSGGTDLRVEMFFATARQGDIWAGMPFDLVPRPEADLDLLPFQPEPELSSILLGQRELDEVRTFPFHDLVAISDQEGSSVVFARGLHAYRAEGGDLYLTLRRSVEWLTRADLKRRIGDAGPFFYVPGARCERRVRHELAYASLPYPATAMALQSLNAAFQNPPLVVRAAGSGELHRWEVLQENLPLSSLQVGAGALLGRFYNPTPHEVAFSRAYPQTDVWGEVQGAFAAVPPKKIANLRLEFPSPGNWEPADPDAPPIVLLNPPQWRVGPNHGAPDPVVLAGLEGKIAGLDEQLVQVAADLALVQGAGEEVWRLRLRLEHRQYTLQRERLECQLSLLLNQRTLEYGGETPQEALYNLDPEIAAVGKELNRLRIKRRIYDYVIQVLD
jgi:alpha-mannosidase